MSRRHLRFALTALLVLATLGATGCGDDEDSSSDSGSESKPEVLIATQAFGESEIVGQIYGQLLADNGFDVSYQSFDDRAAIFAAIDSGDANFVPEYAASVLEFLNGNAGEASPDITETSAKLSTALEELGLVALEPSDAVDSNSLVVTKETSESKSVTKISDLTAEFKLGAPQDCPSNASCLPAILDTYGIDLSSNYQALDASGPLTKEALSKGDVDVAVIFSTDAAIAVNDWIVLEDDKGIFNADNIIPVVTDELADNSELVELSDKASAALSTSKLTDLNKRYDVDKEDAEVIAKDFLTDEGLI